MSIKPLKIASRRSPLAVAQAKLVRAMLAEAEGVASADIEEAYPLIHYVTTGDRALNGSLAEIGGKGLFTKEIEIALLDGEADIAVHSMKDMPAEMPPGLVEAAVPPREDPRDAFVTLDGCALSDLHSGARVGTSSVRRAAQVQRIRPDVTIVPMRGNVGTRLAKLEAGEADATFLAEAGLRRLGHDAVHRVVLDTTDMLPALGQGTLCVQGRAGETDTLARCAKINCVPTAEANAAERALIGRLDGSCRTPIAGIATVTEAGIHLRGEILSLEGDRQLGGERIVPTGGLTYASILASARTAGIALGDELAERAGPVLSRMLGR